MTRTCRRGVYMQRLCKTVNCDYGWVRKAFMEEEVLSRVLQNAEEFAR